MTQDDLGTWWEPTLKGIEKAYEDGEFDYATKPSIGLLLDLLTEQRAALDTLIERVYGVDTPQADLVREELGLSRLEAGRE